jgi:hypothetical protein
MFDSGNPDTEPANDKGSSSPPRVPLAAVGERPSAFSLGDSGPSPDEFRGRLIELGWQQGSILPSDPELAEAVELSPFSRLRELPQSYWLIVSFNDCVTVSGNYEADPAVEVVVATPLDAVRESRRHLRHTRELHFHLVGKDGRKQAVEVNVRDRGFLSRRLLAKYSPDTSISIPASSVAEIAGLLSGRYDHVAFPDAFEKRMAKAKSQLERVLKDHVGVLAEIFLIVKPLKEITSDEEAYTLSVYAVVHDEVADGPGPELNVLKDTIAGAIRKPIRRCDGIILEKVSVCGFDEITVREFAGMKPIDLTALTHERRAAAESLPNPELPSRGP